MYVDVDVAHKSFNKMMLHIFIAHALCNFERVHTLELIKFGMCHVGRCNHIWHLKPHSIERWRCITSTLKRNGTPAVFCFR